MDRAPAPRSPTPYFAHSANDAYQKELLREHLRCVGGRAAQFAPFEEATDEARLLGLLHDLGKYGDLFRERLEGKRRHVDHWSAGAWAALTQCKQLGVAAALAIQGHHVGLQRGDKDSLRDLNPKKLAKSHPLSLTLSGEDIEQLLSRFRADGLELPELNSSVADLSAAEHAAFMLDVRMLFSALVDADFLETEAHFRARPDGTRYNRPAGPPLQPQRALDALIAYVEKLEANSKAASNVQLIRSDLLQTCLSSGDSPQGLFTLTAPTGSGKTFAMLAFALRHAVRHNLRRIVMVIPYLTIIEQTAREYRKVFGQLFPESYLLEHHSLAGTHGKESGKGEDGQESTERLLAQNWDAPIVVTTSVQMLESLLSNRPSACRKLHRLSRSVILFDEVQTLPTQLAAATLATLAHLCHRTMPRSCSRPPRSRRSKR